jgi:outer membrane cobalamin receptor
LQTNHPQQHLGGALALLLVRTTVAVLLLAYPAQDAHAQYPGELTGKVKDALTGEPVDHVLVELVGMGVSALTDGRGEFELRGLEAGRHVLRFSRLGYAPQEQDIHIRHGHATRLLVSLGASPIPLDEVRAEAGRSEAGVTTIAREEIERSGELTAAGLLTSQAGLVVQRRGLTGPQTLSIRGSAADEVLVLLDGAPLNDPLTGAADLSSVPTSQVENITVLRGSQSARFGPGAAGGAVLIRSRATAAPLGLRLETGSLGFWSGSAETAGRALGLSLSAGGQARAVDGEFEYERPDALGGGSAVRGNSDLAEASFFGAAAGELGGGQLRLRGGYSRLDRGLPGPSFSPTPLAREELTRWRGAAAWENGVGPAQISAQANVVAQSVRFSDPQPAFGFPYDSRTQVSSFGGRLTVVTPLEGVLRSLSGGTELRQQRYASTALDEAAPDGRLDFGAFAAAELAGGNTQFNPRLIAAFRLDRDDLGDIWYGTHEVTVTIGTELTDLHLRHASSYSPPTFGDQFFKEGVAVQPNPNLRAERVPSDLSAGISIDGSIGFAVGRIGVDGYVADVKDMIIWAPDFRFVWSPRNFDVKRRGLDVEGALEFSGQRLDLRATYSYMRATYDRPSDDTVQVVYRPRHSGSLGASWRPQRWEFDVDARFIGARNPVPAPLNQLPSYWTLDLRLRRSFDAGIWEIVPTLAVDRLFNNQASLIFGYPEAGRLIRFEIAARPGAR